ncbi:hypothetical protein R8Z57_06900 [Microbacterium sp. M3]|uniref:PH domain-containing protein n=1 Tax=Microbacterium arthrosphaerae TaxID=792652 RepID=A0ABU4GZK3_9MICO|nr:MULTISPECIES: hypothetical protein [Microbacterium]MDW4572508.1 hypothetical protein [Microbacterium arthrosphaerae]MDW7606363.1 hypothetical protein [Microbacterium sp. M3]
MTREGALTIIVAVAVGLIGLLVWAWWRRMRRDAVALVHPGELPADAHVRGSYDVLYVATTRRYAPLERIAAPGMGFRSKATVTVADEGVAVAMTGQEPFLLAPEQIVDVSQSTVAIDRVVEPGGLTRLTWRTDANTTVDSYFRPQDASARALADAVAAILPPTQTGTAA